MVLFLAIMISMSLTASITGSSPLTDNDLENMLFAPKPFNIGASDPAGDQHSTRSSLIGVDVHTPLGIEERTLWNLTLTDTILFQCGEGSIWEMADPDGNLLTSGVDQGSVTPTIPGTYEVQCSDGGALHINVTSTGGPMVTIEDIPSNVTSGTRLALNSTAITMNHHPDAFRYHWNITAPDGKVVSPTGPRPSHTFTGKGVHTIEVTVDDDITSTRYITVLLVDGIPPVARLEPITEEYLTRVDVPLNASLSSDPDDDLDRLTFRWFVSRGSGELEAIPLASSAGNHSFTDDGNYSVLVEVTDNDGEVSTTHTTITILNREPIARIVSRASFESIEVGERVSFGGDASRDLDGSIEHYSWTSGETTLTDPQVNLTFSTVGKAIVSLVVTDDDGASGHVTLNVTVIASTTTDDEGVFSPGKWLMDRAVPLTIVVVLIVVAYSVRPSLARMEMKRAAQLEQERADEELGKRILELIRRSMKDGVKHTHLSMSRSVDRGKLRVRRLLNQMLEGSPDLWVSLEDHPGPLLKEREVVRLWLEGRPASRIEREVLVNEEERMEILKNFQVIALSREMGLDVYHSPLDLQRVLLDQFVELFDHYRPEENLRLQKLLANIHPEEAERQVPDRLEDDAVTSGSSVEDTIRPSGPRTTHISETGASGGSMGNLGARSGSKKVDADDTGGMENVEGEMKVEGDEKDRDGIIEGERAGVANKAGGKKKGSLEGEGREEGSLVDEGREEGASESKGKKETWTSDEEEGDDFEDYVLR